MAKIKVNVCVNLNPCDILTLGVGQNYGDLKFWAVRNKFLHSTYNQEGYLQLPPYETVVT